ncbi:MAG TPA: PD-(D/E)XK nuclease family protein [Acidisarcina sp.]
MVRSGAARAELASRIADCLKAGGVVLTGNARAARALNLQYSAMQRRNGLGAWAAPNIRDWAGWINSMWEQILLSEEDAPLLLSPLQELEVWTDVARQQGDARLLVSVQGMAELAQSAYARMGAYEAHGARARPWDHGGSVDAEVFRRWATGFDELCARHRWISRSMLEVRASAAISAGVVEAPGQVLMTGFDRVLPAQHRVLDALARRGCRTALLETDDRVGAADPGSTGAPALTRSGDQEALALIEAKDPRGEIEAAARWARVRIVEDPGCRIAVLVQDAAAVRGEIERTFRRVLLPTSSSIAAPAGVAPFEFSLGRPLSAAASVRAALLLLRWVGEPLPQEDLSWLLLSGLLGGGSAEWLAIAQADRAMRAVKGRPPEIALHWWIERSGRLPMAEAQALRQRLMGVEREATASGAGGHESDRARKSKSGSQRRDSPKLYSDWVNLGLRLLDLAGWPGRDPEDSVQFQARRKWEQTLDSVAALAFDGQPVEYGDFVEKLTHAAAGTIFSPESQSAPIQIMSPMESAGQQFDAVWFMGADDLHWPGGASPHPLIPLRVQRDAGMPHASPAADWELAVRVTRRIARSAGECVFSCSKQMTDGAGKPSPVLAEAAGRELRLMAADEFLSALGVVSATRHEVETVEIRDESLIRWPEAQVAGGANILKMQAACPFQAFADRRLGAVEADKGERGLTPEDRGEILHRVLETLWSDTDEPPWRLHTRDDLGNAMATGRLDDIVEHHVRSVLTKRRDGEDAWTVAYFANEQQRLCRLLTEWLRLEAEQPPFAVEAREKKVDGVDVAGLRLNLRIDRVNRLLSGERLLLDYKTSDVSTTAWQGDRPDAPQLPLYAAFGGIERVSGVLFAQLRPHEMAFVGQTTHALSKLVAGPKGLPLYDDAVREQWAETLRQLAQGFLAGDATVTPKKYPQTCQYCPLPSLCRVAETQVPLDALEIDDPKFDRVFDSGGE